MSVKNHVDLLTGSMQSIFVQMFLYLFLCLLVFVVIVVFFLFLLLLEVLTPLCLVLLVAWDGCSLRQLHWDTVLRGLKLWCRYATNKPCWQSR